LPEDFCPVKSPHREGTIVARHRTTDCRPPSRVHRQPPGSVCDYSSSSRSEVQLSVVRVPSSRSNAQATPTVVRVPSSRSNAQATPTVVRVPSSRPGARATPTVVCNPSLRTRKFEIKCTAIRRAQVRVELAVAAQIEHDPAAAAPTQRRPRVEFKCKDQGRDYPGLRQRKESPAAHSPAMRQLRPNRLNTRHPRIQQSRSYAHSLRRPQFGPSRV
jgi:hypothetical protein